MKHPRAALALLIVGLLLSYAWYWAPNEAQGHVQNVASNALILYLLACVALVFASPEVTAVVALLAVFKTVIIVCNVWWLAAPWPVMPGQATCSAKFDMPLGVVGLGLGTALLAYFLIRRAHV